MFWPSSLGMCVPVTHNGAGRSRTFASSCQEPAWATYSTSEVSSTKLLRPPDMAKAVRVAIGVANWREQFCALYLVPLAGGTSGTGPACECSTPSYTAHGATPGQPISKCYSPLIHQNKCLLNCLENCELLESLDSKTATSWQWHRPEAQRCNYDGRISSSGEDRYTKGFSRRTLIAAHAARLSKLAGLGQRGSPNTK